jgi:hypothetical protein
MQDPLIIANENQIQWLKYEEAKVRLDAAKWDLRTKKLAVTVAVLGIPGIGAVTVWGALRNQVFTKGPVFIGNHPSVAVILHAVQALAMWFFVRWHRKWLRETATTLRDMAPVAPIAQETLRQFTLGWEGMWYGWLLLYSWFTVAALTPLARLT